MATVTNSQEFDYALAPFGNETKAAGKGFWRSLLDALIESRQRSAARELRRFGLTFPPTEETIKRDDLPF